MIWEGMPAIVCRSYEDDDGFYPEEVKALAGFWELESPGPDQGADVPSLADVHEKEAMQESCERGGG